MSKANASPRLVFLYGPPAVGKLTVATALAAARPFRVLHNHVTFDPVAEVLPFGTTSFWEVVHRFRIDLVGAAAREGIDLVYTFVFAPGDESDVDDVVHAFEGAGGAVSLVQLVAPPDELRRRVVLPSRRAHGKIADVATLDDVLAEHDVYAPIPRRDSLTIDVSAMSAEDAAAEIIERLAL